MLIHGASGGVGSFAVQFAKTNGAYFIRTASGRNQTFLRELGVDEPSIMKGRNSKMWSVMSKRYSILREATRSSAYGVLKKGGILVSVIQRPSAEEAAQHGVRSTMFGRQPNTGELTDIAKLVDSGKVKVPVETGLPLSEVKRAHQLSQTGLLDSIASVLTTWLNGASIARSECAGARWVQWQGEQSKDSPITFCLIACSTTGSVDLVEASTST